MFHAIHSKSDGITFNKHGHRREIAAVPINKGILGDFQ
jgi:hypothetical protein